MKKINLREIAAKAKVNIANNQINLYLSRKNSSKEAVKEIMDKANSGKSIKLLLGDLD